METGKCGMIMLAQSSVPIACCMVIYLGILVATRDNYKFKYIEQGMCWDMWLELSPGAQCIHTMCLHGRWVLLYREVLIERASCFELVIRWKMAHASMYVRRWAWHVLLLPLHISEPGRMGGTWCGYAKIKVFVDLFRHIIRSLVPTNAWCITIKLKWLIVNMTLAHTFATMK